MIELERDAPDLEDLAAYLDGRLSEERRSSVEERLLRDEDYYEVFLETVRCQQEHGQADSDEGGATIVTPPVWWRSWRTMAPLAVAATVVIAFGGWRLMLGPPIAAWVERLDTEQIVEQEGWDQPDWSILRSGSGSEPIPDPDLQRRLELAFRIGTHTVDLRVALAAGDEGAAKRAAASIEERSGEILVVPLISGIYADLYDRIGKEASDALAAEAKALEESLEEFLDGPEAARYALGRWNEVGRLAALAHDAKALRGIWRRRRGASGLNLIATPLARIGAIVKQRPRSPEDFKAAEAEFSEIADTLAGRG